MLLLVSAAFLLRCAAVRRVVLLCFVVLGTHSSSKIDHMGAGHVYSATRRPVDPHLDLVFFIIFLHESILWFADSVFP